MSFDTAASRLRAAEFSLSPRERAGVRGNGRSKFPKRPFNDTARTSGGETAKA